jgi:hypothetical protein
VIPKEKSRKHRIRFFLTCLFSAFILSAQMLAAQGLEVKDLAPVGDSLLDTTEIITAAPVQSLIASDYKYDNGKKIDLSWVPSIDDELLGKKVTGYRVYEVVADGEPVLVTELPPGANSYTVDKLERGQKYSFFVSAVTPTSEFPSIHTEYVTPQWEWINYDMANLFIIALVLGVAIFYFIETARRGKDLFVRKIAGLEAVDEAIGRATEMGRPILYIPGINDMDDVQTLAALTILGRVAGQVAEYETQIRMPVSRSLVMTAARETIKQAYQTAGRPDAYSDDMVNYVTDEQFGYVAAVDGIMVREKPATVFLLGAFFAESLILAETGNSIGAIQIAGTARPAQLPFFIAACDFTLIGEELFAASAYLSGEPKQLGSLKGQDVGKALAMVALTIGVILATLAAIFDAQILTDMLNHLTNFFTA